MTCVCEKGPIKEIYACEERPITETYKCGEKRKKDPSTYECVAQSLTVGRCRHDSDMQKSPTKMTYVCERDL